MNYFCFSQQKGSSALLRAHGSGRASATINKLAPQKKFRAKPKQAGKKEGGLGEGIFAHLLTAPKARLGWERFHLSAQAEDQNRKIFFSLIVRLWRIGSARLKELRENFSVLLAVRRAETRGGVQSKSASGFSLKKVRISFRVRSQIVCCDVAASALRASAGRFASLFHGILGITETFRSCKMRFAAQSAEQTNVCSQSFFSPLRASCKAIIFCPKAIKK